MPCRAVPCRAFLQLYGVWQAMNDGSDGDPPPDRIEIFVRDLGQLAPGLGAEAQPDDGDDACQVAYHRGGGGGGGAGELPSSGPALLWCTLYGFPAYVNTIAASTEVVVFIAGGDWAMPAPLPLITRDVTIVGSNVPGDADEYVFKAIGAPDAPQAPFDPKSSGDGSGSSGKSDERPTTRPKPRTSYDENKRKLGRGACWRVGVLVCWRVGVLACAEVIPFSTTPHPSSVTPFFPATPFLPATPCSR